MGEEKQLDVGKRKRPGRLNSIPRLTDFPRITLQSRFQRKNKNSVAADQMLPFQMRCRRNVLCLRGDNITTHPKRAMKKKSVEQNAQEKQLNAQGLKARATEEHSLTICRLRGL